MWPTWHNFCIRQLRVFYYSHFPPSLQSSLCCIWLDPLPEFWGSPAFDLSSAIPNHSFIQLSPSSQYYASLFLERGKSSISKALVIFPCRSTWKHLSSSSVWEPLLILWVDRGVHLFHSYHSTRGHHSCSHLKEGHSSFISMECSFLLLNFILQASNRKSIVCSYNWANAS